MITRWTGLALLLALGGCDRTPSQASPREPLPVPPLHGALEDPEQLPPVSPDFPTHHLADHISQALVDHLEGRDPQALPRAAGLAEELITQQPDYRFAHQLHAYTQRLAHGPEAEARVLADLPHQEPAAYRYFFDRAPDQVGALLRCNLVASCTWREGRPGFRKPGGAPFELVALDGSTPQPENIQCGGRSLDPDSCPADFPVFERSSWLEMGRDRLGLWSTEHTPLTIELLIRELGIEPGMRVADIGAGAGWFAFPFARQVGPEGRLLALDIDPAFVGYLDAVARDSALPQLDALLSEGTLPELEPGSLDLIWVALVFQDLYLADLQAGSEPQQGLTMAFAHALADGLRPGGTLAVTEIGPRSNGTGAEIETGFSLQALWALLEGAGLEPRRQVSTVIHAELRLFGKPSEPRQP
jgi:SAM-dependent methyltransferase